VPNFAFRLWKRNETKVAKEYCWAITVTTGGGHSAADHVPLCWSFGFYLFLTCDVCRYFCNVTVGSAVTVTALARREAQRTSTRVAVLALERQFRDAPSMKKV